MSPVESLRAAPRLCIFSQHHPQGRLPAYVRLHLEAIRRAGYRIVLVAAGGLAAEEGRAAEALCDLVLARENVGYDFGNWRHALLHLGELQAERLLLVNDSVYGPFADLGRWLDALTATPADMWGAIESEAFGRHLQSWLLVLSPAAHRSPAFRELLRDPVDPALRKWALVERYELGLSRRLLEAGLRLAAAYVAEEHGALARRLAYNPCGVLWRELVEGPVPYVKASILRANPTLSPGVGRWRRVCDPLDPRVAAAAAQDLATRDARPPTTLWSRWRASLDRKNPVDWPEVQAVLRADYGRRPASPEGGTAELAYRLASGVGAQVRRSACGRRPRDRTGRRA